MSKPVWNEPSASGRSHLEAEARPQHRRRHTDAHGDKDEVLRYCENDVRALGDVYALTAARGGCKRKTKRGNTTFAAFPLVEGALISVAAAAARVVKDEVPDTSWMKDPPDLLASVAWIWPAG